MLKAEQSEPITEPLWNGAGQQLKCEENEGDLVREMGK